MEESLWNTVLKRYIAQIAWDLFTALKKLETGMSTLFVAGVNPAFGLEMGLTGEYQKQLPSEKR